MWSVCPLTQNMFLSTLKSILPLFRCLAAIERSVEQCQISISSPPADRVTIQFFCRHGRKHHENVTLQTSCRFRGDHRLLQIHPDLFKANYSLLTRILSFYAIMYNVSSTTRCIANCQHLVAVSSSIVSSLLSGITKTHNLRFQDSEALQAVFSSHLCPNALKAPARSAASRTLVLIEDSFLFLFSLGFTTNLSHLPS